jgi:hypothetical protein
MPTPVALLKFKQGALIGANGEALAGTIGGGIVEIENSSNLYIQSWRINLVYTPPGCSVPIANPLTENPNGNIPYAAFVPDVVPGCYRIQLLVYNGVNYSGDWEEDIRNFAIPDPAFGMILPPYQMLPPKLPLPGTGQPNEKPDELNFGGQPYGWDGYGNEGLILNFLREVLAGTFGGTVPVIEEVDQDDSPVTVAFGKRYLVNNDGAVQANNIVLNLPALTDGDLNKRVYFGSRYTHEYALGVSGGALITCAGSDLIFMGGLLGHQPTLLLDQSEDNVVMSPYKKGSNYYWVIE